MDVDQILTQARELTEGGQHQEALEQLDAGLQAEPEVAPLHYLKGVVLQSLGDEDQALACYTRATELAPDMAPAWVNRGRLLDDDCRSEEAIVCYEAAIQLSPEDTLAWANKGNSLLSLERFSEALECYDHALGIDGEDPRIKLGRSSALASLGRIEEANAARPIGTPLDRGEVIELTKSLGEKTLVLRYYPGQHQRPDALAELARTMLEAVAAEDSGGAGLEDGAHIAYGWSALTIREREGRLVLCEPAFQRNPFDDVVHDVSFTLQAMFMTGLLHNMVGVGPCDCMFVHGVALHPPSLYDAKVGMRRFHEPHENNVSGWMIGPPDRERLAELWENGEFEMLPSAMLIHIQHHLIKALTLPPGYTAFFDAHALTSVLDPEGKEVWNTREGSAESGSSGGEGGAE